MNQATIIRRSQDFLELKPRNNVTTSQQLLDTG